MAPPVGDVTKYALRAATDAAKISSPDGAVVGGLSRMENFANISVLQKMSAATSPSWSGE